MKPSFILSSAILLILVFGFNTGNIHLSMIYVLEDVINLNPSTIKFMYFSIVSLALYGLFMLPSLILKNTSTQHKITSIIYSGLYLQLFI